MVKRVCILGSTGSIGRQALEVCEALRFPVTGLAARSSVKLLADQAERFHPKAVCVFDETKFGELNALLRHTDIELLCGMEGLCRLAALPDCDIVLNGVVGMVGLQPTLAAIRAGKPLALANKETLVTGGALVMDAAAQAGVPILPVDSEHSAIFQSLQGNTESQVKKLILTASGGPFYGKSRRELEGVTVEQALRHPNWSMGAKITIDSATLMNKGLELMEACWLFGRGPEEIEILVHRESVIHSLVEYVDHAVIAQLGVPSMKIPIQYALTYPERLPCPVEELSLADCGGLSFGRPDEETFRCLWACKEAMAKGGLYPALVNGANEEAVGLFLAGRIPFLEIGGLVCGALELEGAKENFTLEDILSADRAARAYVRSQVGEPERSAQA